MAVRTTVDIPEPIHEQLRHRAASTGVSIRSLIVRALEDTYAEKSKGRRVTGPMVKLRGKKGPRFPVDETPHDLILP